MFISFYQETLGNKCSAVAEMVLKMTLKLILILHFIWLLVTMK